METMILKDPGVSPTKRVLENALGRTYPAYQELINTITAADFGLSPEWHYYNDGKRWLCKVQYKKKTVFWLSVFNKYFKVSFYFTEKSGAGIAALDIDKNIKENFAQTKPTGKLRPLTIIVNNKAKLSDLLKVAEYKKGLK